VAGLMVMAIIYFMGAVSGALAIGGYIALSGWPGL